MEFGGRPGVRGGSLEFGGVGTRSSWGRHLEFGGRHLEFGGRYLDFGGEALGIREATSLMPSRTIEVPRIHTSGVSQGGRGAGSPRETDRGRFGGGTRAGG